MHEFDGEVPTRQVERYGGRWFDSQTEYHAELGPGLVDQALSELAFNPEQEISAAEFEESWGASGAGSG